MKILTIAMNFPDKYYPIIAPWSKSQVDSIKKYTNLDVEVIAPRPITLPFKFFPYHNFSKLPKKIYSDLNYPIHYPKFLYLLPKKIFFNLTGDLFSFFISSYILDNIEKPDIIHSRFSYPDGYGVLKVCRKWNVNLIFDMHGIGDLGQFCNSIFRSKKFRKTIDYASKILCVANWQIEEALNYGVPEEKVVSIPLGIDIDKFKPRDKNRIKKELYIKEEKILLFVGNIRKEKGVYEVIKIFHKLLVVLNHKNIRLIMVGDGNEKNNIMKISKKLNILHKITFTGKLFGEELQKVYSLADIFLFPSHNEGRPTVINEAMASECVIISSNIGGIPEQVINGYNGFLVNTGDIETIIEKIGFLLNNENEISRMGKNSRLIIIKNRWTWHGYALRVAKIYKEVAQKEL